MSTCGGGVATGGGCGGCGGIAFGTGIGDGIAGTSESGCGVGNFGIGGMVMTAPFSTGGGGSGCVTCQMIMPASIRPISTSAIIAKITETPDRAVNRPSLKTCLLSTVGPYGLIVSVLGGDTDLGHPRFAACIHGNHQILK